MRYAEQLVNLIPLRSDRSVSFPTPKFVPTSAYVIDEKREKVVDKTTALEVHSLKSSPMTVTHNNTTSRRPTMNLTLKGTSKNGKKAFYQGAATVIQIPVRAFTGGTAPQSFDVADGLFEAPKAPKAKLTPEERKAARANKPQLTLAEKIAKREAQIAKMKAKLDAEAAGAQQTM